MTPSTGIAHPQYTAQLPAPICLPLAKGYLFISPQDVEYFEADDNYSWISTTDHPIKRMIGVALGRVGSELDGSWFCRIHRSYIVSILHIAEMDPDKTSVRLDNGTWLPIGRSYRKQFFEKLMFCK